jgi:hypothetical protein
MFNRALIFLIAISLKSFSEPEKFPSKFSHPFISGFIKNEGQFKDSDGNSIPFVIAKANASGMDVYLHDKGLSYVFRESKKTSSSKSPLTAEYKVAEKLYRIDANLKGARIKKENIEFLEENKQIHCTYFFDRSADGIYITE